MVTDQAAQTEQLLASGADGVVARPFREDDLRWAVARLAARRRRQVAKMERRGSPRRSWPLQKHRHPSPPKLGLVPYTRFDSPLKTTREHAPALKPVLHQHLERHNSPLKTSRQHREHAHDARRRSSTMLPEAGFAAIYGHGE